MTRLVQGDVGSGKNCRQCSHSFSCCIVGFQVSVMAPTEILAEQLFSVYRQFFAHQQVSVAFLSASTKASREKSSLRQLLDGEII